MSEQKFRYVFKNKNFGDLSFYYLSLKEIENGKLITILKSGMIENGYELISRDRYTGLKDKNNKEIYEEDIIRFMAFAPKHDEIVTAKVEWHFHWSIAENSEMAGFQARDLKEKYLSYGIGGCGGKEIIGNIYENPELLKGDK